MQPPLTVAYPLDNNKAMASKSPMFFQHSELCCLMTIDLALLAWMENPEVPQRLAGQRLGAARP